MNCRACSDLELYKTCVGKPWYSYGDIYFCEHQVMWIIQNFIKLVNNKTTEITLDWPDTEWPDTDGSSYTDMPTSKVAAKNAYFTHPAEIVAEVEYRLRQLPEKLRLRLLRELEVKDLIDDLTNEALNALYYISGNKRKGIYWQWRRDE